MWPNSPRIWNMRLPSKRWLANPNWGCTPFSSQFLGLKLVFLFIIKVVIKWSCRSLAIVLSIEPRMVIIIWTCNSIIINSHVSLVFVLGAIPNCIPLKYRCPIKISSWIRQIYLVSITNQCYNPLWRDVCGPHVTLRNWTPSKCEWSKVDWW